MSNEHQIRSCKLLDNQELPENELAIVSATREHTSVVDQDMETNSKLAVREE